MCFFFKQHPKTHWTLPPSKHRVSKKKTETLGWHFFFKTILNPIFFDGPYWLLICMHIYIYDVVGCLHRCQHQPILPQAQLQGGRADGVRFSSKLRSFFFYNGHYGLRWKAHDMVWYGSYMSYMEWFGSFFTMDCGKRTWLPHSGKSFFSGILQPSMTCESRGLKWWVDPPWKTTSNNCCRYLLEIKFDQIRILSYAILCIYIRMIGYVCI